MTSATAPGSGASSAERARALLEEMRSEYRKALPGKLAEIDALLARARSEDEAAGEALRRAVHSLAGSAQTFGLPDVTTAARALEAALAMPAGADAAQALERGFTKLRAAASA